MLGICQSILPSIFVQLEVMPFGRDLWSPPPQENFVIPHRKTRFVEKNKYNKNKTKQVNFF